MAERLGFVLFNNADKILKNGISFGDNGDVNLYFRLVRVRRDDPSFEELMKECVELRRWIPLFDNRGISVLATARLMSTCDFEKNLPGSCVVYQYYLHDDLEQAFAFDRNGRMRKLKVINKLMFY